MSSSAAPQPEVLPKNDPIPTPSPTGFDLMIWVWAACSSTIASMLFLIPAFYWLALHGLAIIGFFSIVTGKSKALWPPFENALSTAQRVLEAVHWPINISNARLAPISAPPNQPPSQPP